MGAYFDRGKKVADERKAGSVLKDPAAHRDFPLLMEIFSERISVGNKDQARCSVGVFIHEGMWKVSIRDKTDQTVLFVAAPTLAKLWDAVETMLESPEAEWRLDRFAGHAKASRVRKKLDTGEASD